MKKRYVLFITIIVVVVAISIILVVKFKGTESLIDNSVVNLNDGLQKEELESLSEDDYRRLNSPDIYNLDLDDVDNTYYYKMIEMPGVYKGNATREEREKIHLYQNDLKAAALEMCKKDGDWSLIINSNEISGFNQKDGLLAGFKYNSIESGDWVGDDYSGYVDVVVKNDSEERKYRISIYKEDGIIQSVKVKLGEVSQLNRGHEVDLTKLKFDKEHLEDNFNNLCKYESAYKGGLDWDKDDIGITEHFYGKYQYFLDIFIHYSPLEYNKITLKDLDVENQMATFEVDSVLECKRRTYEVNYVLDNNQYLDDVDVDLIAEEEIDAIIKNFNLPLIFYKNSNWIKYKKVINYSDAFYEKFSALGSYFLDIDKIDINTFKFKLPYNDSIKVIEDKPGSIVMYLWSDNTRHYYYCISKYDERGQLDDYINEPLLYDSSMNLEEVRDAYIRDYVENK